MDLSGFHTDDSHPLETPSDPKSNSSPHSLRSRLSSILMANVSTSGGSSNPSARNSSLTGQSAESASDSSRHLPRGGRSNGSDHSILIPQTPTSKRTHARTSIYTHTRGGSSSSIPNTPSTSSRASSRTSNHSRSSLNTLTSRISLRHGIPQEQMRLLDNAPPETVLASLDLSDVEDTLVERSLSGPSTSSGPTGAVPVVLPSATATAPSTPSKVKSRSRPSSLVSMPPKPRSPAPFLAGLKRHPDLWFPDGSVILRADSTLFCVHMSQLARHSLVFHDMFMLPQPPVVQSRTDAETGFGKGSGDREEEEADDYLECDADDTNITLVSNANGFTKGKAVSPPPVIASTQSRRVPVVRLYDQAEDVANLLTALYDGPTFTSNSPSDFRVCSGVLRLSTKYLIDSLRAKALMHLSVAWPSDLRGWDLREDLARDWEGTGGEGNGRRYPHPAAVISLAREVNAPSLLPSAFYDLSRYSFSQIFEPSEDDDLFTSPSITAQAHIPPSSLLTPQDIQSLCLGKESAQNMITNLIHGMGNGHTFRFSQYPPFSVGLSSLSGTASPVGGVSSNTLSHGHGHTAHSRKHSSNAHLVCLTAAACRKDFGELVDLATQHYLFDKERGCSDPLYVAEELGQLKSAEFSSYSSSASTSSYGSVGVSGMGGGGECKACARQLEAWAARERERIWKMIPSWFRLEGN